LPYFVSSIQPSNLSLSALQPTSAARQTQYDGFGRPLFTYTYDGAQDSATSYHAVSTDVYDANHLPSFTDPFPTTTQKDGHGRVVLTQVSGRIGQNSAVTTVQTRSIYTAAGNLTTLSRTSGGTTVTQSIAYDSLGRMVENREPNTTTGTNDWRYVYNDSGELVGTSDPRGCGENIAYDAAGREVSEDYSPCAANQVEYSPPLGTGAGLETLYVYDAPVGSTPTSPDGRLYGTISRGEFTQFTYDPRGRKQTVTRTLALPGVPASDWHERFSKSSYSYTIGYDDADRVVTQGTGATALAVGGASTVTTGYDERGNIYSLTSSYGNLVTSAAFEADGQLLNYQYADHAQTLAQRDYNSLRRLWHSNVGRSPAWVQNGAIYTQPSGGTTLESILEAKTFTYDPVGNPVIIADSSGTTVWPAGAARMTRTVGYDDFYHVTSVADNTGGDAFIQPYAPEFAGTTDAPMPATLASTRIVSQTFNYDWLGNTTGSTDDQSLFYDRSLGTITNDLVYPNRMDSAVGATANDNLSVSYDAQGDVIGVGVARSKPCTSPCVLENLVYEWDELGFLARATREEKHGPLIEVVADITYAYDGAGQRVLKAVTMDGSLLYTAEIFPTLRLNGATWYPSTSQYEDDVTTESAYLAGAAGSVARVEYSTTDPAVINSGSLDNLRVLFELSDALGSTSFVIDRDTSEVVEAAAYQPYGALDSDFRTSRWGNFREQHKFTGKEDDIEVGVTYFGGRYYAANLGRWLSADPVAVHTRKGNLNVYAYASGRVFSVTDPTGLMDDNGAMLNGSSDLVMNTFGVAGAAGQLAQTVPGFDTFVALQMQWASTDPMSAGNAFLNGSANFASDPINGVANFFGVSGQVVPTFAPAQSTTNIFDALSYAAGGAVTSAAVFAGGGAALDGLADTVNLSAAFSSIGRTAAAVGDGLSAFSADTRGGLNLANLAGNAAEGAGAAGQKIALGLGDTLDEFAGQTGGSTWKQWAGKDPMNWKGAFQDVVGNPANEVHFNLTGVDSPWAGAARAARGAGGATDWELLQIQQNQGWWSRITFWNNGQAVPNPFQ
jgi:RHS repeat-associated protein